MSHIPLSTVKRDVDQVLAAYFDEQIMSADTIDPRYGKVWRQMRDQILAGGKRLRPYLLILAYEGYGGASYTDALLPAAAQELFHAGLLIHDDIMDQDDHRYGRLNIAGSYRARYMTGGADPAKAAHLALGTALLTGDLALSAASELIEQSRFDVMSRATASALLRRTLFEVVGGQLLDGEASIMSPIEVDCLAIARYKTATYSFISPLCMGVVLAGASTPGVLAALKTFGREAGIAYQLADDIRGMFALEHQTGKPALGDLREGKRTYLMQQSFIRANSADRKFLEDALGSTELTLPEQVRVRRIILQSGAKDYTIAQIHSRLEVASAALDQPDVTPAVRDSLRQLIGKSFWI